MAIYDIRIAKKEDGIRVQSFIDNYWKKGHALVKSSLLFDFQHLNNKEDHYNFFVAERENEIDAIIGFIPTSQFDQNLSNQGDIWGAIWKKREDIDNMEIKDVSLYQFLQLFKLPNFHSFSAIGISESAMKIYKAFRCKTGYLSHYYILNNHTHNLQIAGNVDESKFGTAPDYTSESGWRVSVIEPRDLSMVNIKPAYRPYKSIEYLKNRYEKHPIYKYKFYGVYNKHDLTTILVTRLVQVKDAKVLRIVDALGELQGSLYDSFQEILHSIDAEYVDFMNYGIDESVFFKMGFRKLDLDGELIIPNYFEPFEQCNVKIDIAWKADYENYVAFKGDSDQDRPNVL